ncbi:hypothetical protein MLD38_006583 [Melastoma candidum]|uniref:Uncharacterized protein n=1 Tax=Melastoma candidum TaxID=119954 RepID=A0ACB9RMK7_9MYRT|nr:hypothetical protein MLD38_006583 [Melastoma candidum]
MVKPGLVCHRHYAKHATLNNALIPDIQEEVLIPVSMTENSKATASRASDSVDLRSSAPFGTRVAMSFAAAAMAELGSGGPSEPPKFLFTSVLETRILKTKGDKGTSGGSSKNAIVKATKSIPSTSNSDVQLQRMPLLDRILQDIENFAVGKISNLDELSDTGTRVPAEGFSNSKLTPKLSGQIQDALELCSGSLPTIMALPTYKTLHILVSFRFYSTTFGLSKALYQHQQQQGVDGHASAIEREVRVGRLHCQKIRDTETA